MKYEVTGKDGVFTVIDKEASRARFQIYDGEIVISGGINPRLFGSENTIEEAREFFMACGAACEMAMESHVETVEDKSNRVECIKCGEPFYSSNKAFLVYDKLCPSCWNKIN